MVKVKVEHDYAVVDTVEWFDAVGHDVTDYWGGIVERVTHSDHKCGVGEHPTYGGSAERCARDRVVKALVKRSKSLRYFDGDSESLSGHTSNYDNPFSDDFGYTAVPLVRDGSTVSWLVFVSMGDYRDDGLTYVYEIDGSFEDAYRAVSPQLEYACSHEYGQTTSGYSWEMSTPDGSYTGERKDIIADGRARCSRGHFVALTAYDSF